MSKKNIATLLRENKGILIIIAVGLLLIELEIFAVAAMKSGRKSWLQVMDKQGNVIHETDGKHLSDFNKYYFEKTFGPLDNYDMKLAKTDRPFPFRAWFVSAVGIPIGIVLLFAFVVRAYMALLYGDEELKSKEDESAQGKDGTRAESIIHSISRFNIFTIGFFVFMGVIAYWILPNLITFLGKVGMDTLTRYKWLFLGLIIALFGVFVWVIYLKYRLASKAIDAQTEVNKYRMKLEFKHNMRADLQLEHNPRGEPTPLVGWDEKRIIEGDK